MTLTCLITNYGHSKKFEKKRKVLKNTELVTKHSINWKYIIDALTWRGYCCYQELDVSVR